MSVFWSCDVDVSRDFDFGDARLAGVVVSGSLKNGRDVDDFFDLRSASSPLEGLVF